MKLPETLAALAEAFKCWVNPTRISIAWALSREELRVCDLAALLGMSQSAVSHSLRAVSQRGQVAFYTLDDDHIVHLLEERVRHLEEER